jgi:hypothetical protein
VPPGFSSSSLDLLSVMPGPASSDGNQLFVPLASMYASIGNHGPVPVGVSHVPYFVKLTLHDFTNNQSGYSILGGDVTSPNFLQGLNITFSGPAALSLGNDQFQVTPLPPVPLAIADGTSPDQTAGVFAGWGIDAQITPVDAPEPSGLLLAVFGAVLLGLLCGSACVRSRQSVNLPLTTIAW